MRLITKKLFIPSKFLLPCKHSTNKIYRVFKSKLLKKFSCNSASVSTAAIKNNFFVFQIFKLVKLHGLNFSYRHMESANIKIFAFIRFPHINKINIFAL